MPKTHTRRNAFTGSWRISETELWDKDAINLIGAASIKFDGDRSGEFAFIAVRGWMDCVFSTKGGKPLVEFSWQGSDESDDASGRGWATIESDGTMTGRIYFHQGDNSAFIATPLAAPSAGQNRRR